MSPAGIEQAFEAFIDRVEGAIRRMPASEVAAGRDRLRAEAIARHVRMTAKPSFAVNRSANWSGAAMSARACVGFLAFVLSWALIGLMGGLWGVLLGWIPASIIASLCAWAWPVVLIAVVAAVFGIAAVVNQNTAPKPAADPYAAIATPAPVAQVPAQVAQSTAGQSPAAASNVQGVASSETDVSVAAHDASWADHDERVAAAVRGTPLVNATASELNALFEECPSHRISGDPSAGMVCAPNAPPAPNAAAPAPQSAPVASAPHSVVLSASAPVPSASEPRQVAQR